MKTTLFVIIVAIGALAGIYYLGGTPDYVTRARFEEAHKELKQEFDSVKLQLDSVRYQLFELKEVADLLKEDTELLKEASAKMQLSTDTLKAGQKVIYNEVRKAGNKKSLFDAIKTYLK